MKHTHLPGISNTKQVASRPAAFKNWLTFFSIMALMLSSMVGWGQILWSSSAGSAWLTGTNWTGGAVPNSSQIAQFGANPTATSAGINFSSTTNAGTQTNGSRIQEVGAVEITTARTASLTITNSTGTGGANGTFRLLGTTVNSVANTVLRNTSGQTLSLANGGTANMGVVFGNSTNNIISVEGAGGITISAIISGTGNITKTGTGNGVLLLSGANTYTAVTTISAGTLRLGAVNAIPVATTGGGVVLGGGTFSTGATTGFSDGSASTNMGTLTLTSSSTIALGTGSHSIYFAASNAVSWTSGQTLTITGWTGTVGAGTTGTAGKVFVGSSASGLTAAQLAQIRFSVSGVTYNATQLSTGEVVPALNYVITSISPASPTAGSGFSVTVEAQDAGGTARSVSASGSTFSLTTNGNAGAISGTTTGTIPASSSSVTVTGVILASAGTGVTLTATRTSGDILLAGTSASFNVGSAGNPSLSITGGSLSHGSVCPNVSATPITYTITNGGTAATDVVVTSSDAQFVVSNLSSTSIGAGGNATFDVTFTPTSAGAKTATISTFYNTSTASGTASLTGTGTTPVTPVLTTTAATSITASGATLNGSVTTLGVCPASTQRGFVYSLTATNNDPLNGGTGVTTVTVGAAATGAFSQALTGLASGAGYSYKSFVFNGSTYTYGAVQTFTTLGALSLTGTLAHGSVCPNVAATTITYTITNSGAVTAGGITVVSSDPQFVVSNLSSTSINASSTATYQVTFTPTSSGAKSATITVSSTTPGIGSASNTVTGTGSTVTTPVIVTNAATSIGTTTATLNGSITTLGTCPATTTRGFVFSRTAFNADPVDGGAFVTNFVVGGTLATGAFTQAVTAMGSGIGYSYKAYVFNGTTYTYGALQTFTTLTPPANDDCTGAIALTLNTAAISGTVTNASQSLPAINCAAATGTADDDVWYSFTTSIAANYTITVAGGTSFDAVIDLRSGACNGTNIACADAGASGVSESVVAALAASTTYYVRVYHYGSTAPSTPTFTIAVTVPLPQLSVSSGSLTFGNQVQLTSSNSQTFNLSGANLTGAPSSITVNAPSTDFQVSNNNSTWGASTTIAYTTGTLASTPVYVRFTPQSTGAKSGNVSFSGGSVTTPPTVAVSGTGVLVAPVANAASPLTNTSFTANWGAVSGATGYKLDVSLSPTFGNLSFVEPFENALTLFTETAGTGTYTSGTTTSSDAPASVPYASQGTFSYGIAGGRVILASSNFNTTGVSNSSLSFKLASFSVGSTGNGADGADSVTVAISPDGGTTWYNTLKVIGNVNARWAFDATGAASTAYDGDNNSVNFTASAGSSTTATSTVTITNLPQSSNLRVAISLRNDNANERWLIDNFQLTGSANTFVSGYEDLSVGNVTSFNVTGLTPTTTYYYRLRALDGSTPSANSNTITVTTYTNGVATADFRTKATGILAAGSIWEYNTGNAGWVDANQAPTATNNISVESGHTITIGVNFNVGIGKSFVMQTGSALIIAPTGNLGMGGATSSINFNGQPVTVRSTALGTGSLGQMLGTLSGATNVTVERFISTGSGSKAWRLLASNTTGQTIKNAWQEGQAAMATNNTGYGTMITGRTNSFATEAVAVAAGFDKRTQGSSILYQKPSTDKLWPVLSTNIDIANYPAYFLYVRGDRSADFTGANTVATTTPTLRSTGSIFVGDQAVNVVQYPSDSNTTGFTFSRNPYPSAVDMSVVMATRTAGVSSTFQVWDPKIAGSYGLGGYQTFSLNGSTFNISPGGGSYGSTGKIVESGSGVIFQGNGTVTFQEIAKVTGSSLVQRPSEALDANASLRTSLYTNNTATPELADGNLILMDAAYDNNLDLEDARKNTNFGENFGIKKSGTAIAIEKRNMPIAGDTVFFEMSRLKAINYSLVFEPTNMPAANLAAYLEDSYTNTSTPVDLLSTTTYNFSVNANAASSAASRFRLVFREQAPLPVTFAGVKAVQAGANIAVEWKVSNQLNIDRYEVMKSTDGRNFTKAAEVAAQSGAGELTYNWLDQNAITGANYYRVKSVDRSGAVKYTSIVKVVMGKKGVIAVVPNPVKGNSINLQLDEQAVGTYSVQLFTTAGQLLMSKKVQVAAGSSSQSFTLPSTVLSGVYQLEVVLPNKTKQVQKIIIDPAN